MQVLISCHACGMALVEVLARGDEDAAVWLKSILPTIADAHRQRSPECDHDRCDLMIPVEKGQPIGSELKH